MLYTKEEIKNIIGKARSERTIEKALNNNNIPHQINEHSDYYNCYIPDTKHDYIRVYIYDRRVYIQKWKSRRMYEWK